MSKEMREHINKVKSFGQFLNENTDALYKLGNPTFSWIANQLKYVHTVDFEDLKKRSNTLKERRNDIKLEEFQTLFEYYNFCNNNNDEIRYTEAKKFIPTIRDWVWYLLLCQLFPDLLKGEYAKVHPNSDSLYEKPYKQILSLPKLTGDYEKDKVIFHDVVEKEFNETKSPVRNALILYYIYFKKNRLL
jgi:hypothetical protein